MLDPLNQLESRGEHHFTHSLLRILEIDSWRTVYEFPGELSRPLFSLEGQLLAVSPSRVVPAHLIDMATGEERWQING